METIVKKLEEQISFLQNEVNQMSDEIFTQQKEILKLNNELINIPPSTQAKAGYPNIIATAVPSNGNAVLASMKANISII